MEVTRGRPQWARRPRPRLRPQSRFLLLVSTSAMVAAAAVAAAGLCLAAAGLLQSSEPSSSSLVEPSAIAARALAVLPFGRKPVAAGDVGADLWTKVQELDRTLQRNGRVKNFGLRAHALLASIDGSSDKMVIDATRRALDSILEAMYHSQMRNLLWESMNIYEETLATRPNPREAALQAQRHFDRVASELERAGSSWGRSSSSSERSELQNQLRRQYDLDWQHLAGRARSGRGKRVTMEALENLQEKAITSEAQAISRGSSAWSAKWQHMFSTLPLGLRGQYQNGRSTLEVMLLPDTRREGSSSLWSSFWSWVNRLGPLNVAASFDTHL
mmetsp:Transcript_78318/g.162718  ORF Transcript_78318/g.162718 Transcript_78318/m.162718 type:complete len:330 (+) Transcript_78318:98-1087(+)